MAHEYSVQIHDWITHKIEQATADKKVAEEKKDTDRIDYLRGVLEELFFIRKYLTDQIDLDTQQYYQ